MSNTNRVLVFVLFVALVAVAPSVDAARCSARCVGCPTLPSINCQASCPGNGAHCSDGFCSAAGGGSLSCCCLGMQCDWCFETACPEAGRGALAAVGIGGEQWAIVAYTVDAAGTVGDLAVREASNPYFAEDIMRRAQDGNLAVARPELAAGETADALTVVYEPDSSWSPADLGDGWAGELRGDLGDLRAYGAGLAIVRATDGRVEPVASAGFAAGLLGDASAAIAERVAASLRTHPVSAGIVLVTVDTQQDPAGVVAVAYDVPKHPAAAVEE